VVDGVQWVGDDYHWLTVAEVGGPVAVVAGIEIVTAGGATPLIAGAGGVLITGGLAVGGTATAIDIALRSKACREGDWSSCTAAGLSVAGVPFSYLPGCTNFIIGMSGAALGTADDILRSIRDARQSNRQQPLVSSPSKE
jgi:hypothetical protein